MTEEWRTITNFPDYAVSNMGRVKRMRQSGGPGSWKEGHILKAKPKKNGYLQLSLMNDGKKNHTFMVHLLVLNAFVGPPPAGYEANHKDGIKSNPDLANLEWATKSENQLHALRNGLSHSVRGEKVGSAKLKESEVRVIKGLLSAGGNRRDISKMFNTSWPNIYHIEKGETWTHVTYP